MVNLRPASTSLKVIGIKIGVGDKIKADVAPMQTLQISDRAAEQLQNMAAQEHISTSDLIELLITKHSTELAKQRELKTFFQQYHKDLSEFKFDREDANAR
jgi:predicted CopG family antitoxin